MEAFNLERFVDENLDEMYKLLPIVLSKLIYKIKERT